MLSIPLVFPTPTSAYPVQRKKFKTQYREGIDTSTSQLLRSLNTPAYPIQRTIILRYLPGQNASHDRTKRQRSNRLVQQFAARLARRVSQLCRVIGTDQQRGRLDARCAQSP